MIRCAPPSGVLIMWREVTKVSRREGEVVRETLRHLANRGLWQKPGHYYSPIPSQRDWQRPPLEPFGIDLNHDQQVKLADQLAPMLTLEPGRWREPNNMFGQPDAGVHAAMIQHLKPPRVLEVGSGYSTAVALDAAERSQTPVRFTCVEPHPERLRALLRPSDSVEVIASPVQDVPLDTLTALEPGDFLFVDSTHVVKTGSDVVYLMLHVIPRLKPGVIVHVHDIHWPFTYPKRWLEEGRAWNETYLLQALLIGKVLDVVLWPSYLASHGRSEFKGSGSIWMVKR